MNKVSLTIFSLNMLDNPVLPHSLSTLTWNTFLGGDQLDIISDSQKAEFPLGIYLGFDFRLGLGLKIVNF